MTKPSKTTPFAFAFSVVTTLIVSLVNAYGASTLLHLALRYLIGEKSLIVAFFNTFAHLLWLPALLCFPLAVLFRKRATALLVLPAFVAFLFSYGRQFLPRPAPVLAENTQQVTLLTYNLLANIRDRSPRIEIIRTANADVVALQELDLMMADAITSELREQYPYMALHPQRRGTRGQGVLSKYPIIEDTYWQYSWLPNPLGHQRVVLTVHGQRVTLYNLHPTNPTMTGRFFEPQNRRLEFEDILQRTAAETGPLLLAGDLNLPDQADEYGWLTARYSDAYAEAGWGMGWTFPQVPILRLDYVFHNASFTTLEARVWSHTGLSDHYPVFARLALH